MGTWMTWGNRLKRGISHLLLHDRYDLPDGSGYVLRIDVDEFEVWRYGCKIKIDLRRKKRESAEKFYWRLVPHIIGLTELTEGYVAAPEVKQIEKHVPAPKRRAVRRKLSKKAKGLLEQFTEVEHLHQLPLF